MLAAKMMEVQARGMFLRAPVAPERGFVLLEPRLDFPDLLAGGFSQTGASTWNRTTSLQGDTVLQTAELSQFVHYLLNRTENGQIPLIPNVQSTAIQEREYLGNRSSAPIYNSQWLL